MLIPANEYIALLRKRADDIERDMQPDGYVITGIVKEGKHIGEKVWLYWSVEGGGWWQWGPQAWAYCFDKCEGRKFEDAIKTARGQGAWGETCGPYYSQPDLLSIKVEPVFRLQAVNNGFLHFKGD